MTDASIPVDLFNPGQVFASLGFLEAADVLLGDAEGGFDWSDGSNVRFLLRAAGEEDPFAVVLRFLAEATIHRCAPLGYEDPGTSPPEGDGEEDSPIPQGLILSEVFPDSESDRMKLRMKLPIRLESGERFSIDIDHWADGSRRNDFKLYSGNRTAFGIASAMLHGTRKKPGKEQSVGDIKTRGVAELWHQWPEELTTNPFNVLTLMGGSFNFDPRGAWTALDVGYSPNQQRHGIAASPVVELLAAWGLENARPDEYQTRQVRYAAWSGTVPPILARPALAGISVAIPTRHFQFTLDLSGKNKVVTFGREETNP